MWISIARARSADKSSYQQDVPNTRTAVIDCGHHIHAPKGVTCDQDSRCRSCGGGSDAARSRACRAHPFHSRALGLFIGAVYRTRDLLKAGRGLQTCGVCARGLLGCRSCGGALKRFQGR